jgi:hypothetical protein
VLKRDDQFFLFRYFHRTDAVRLDGRGQSDGGKIVSNALSKSCATVHKRFQLKNGRNANLMPTEETVGARVLFFCRAKPNQRIYSSPPSPTPAHPQKWKLFSASLARSFCQTIFCQRQFFIQFFAQFFSNNFFMQFFATIVIFYNATIVYIYIFLIFKLR